MTDRLALSGDELAHVLATGEFDYLEPMTGNCESFAVAVARTVVVDGFVAIYDPFDTSRAVHAGVHLGGTVFDANGRRGDPEELLEYLSFLKPRDFPDAEFESGVEMYNWLEAEYLVVTSTPDEDVLYWKAPVVEAMTSRLDAAIADSGVSK